MVFQRQWCRSSTLTLALLAGVAAAPAAQSDDPVGTNSQRVTDQVPAAPFREVVINGARFFTEPDIVSFLGLRAGAPLPEPPDRLARNVQRHYAEQGYLFAEVAARFDEATGRLTLDVDEGRIDSIEFAGVPDQLAHEFTREFALQPGDVFRQAEAGRALRLLLRPTEGAVQPVGSGPTPATARVRPWDRAFEMVDRDGKRVLIVRLATRRSDFNLSLGTDGREDWFDPADGFSPAIGFNETIFDPLGSNHTFIAGYLSYKFGRDYGGYSIGFERPLFGNPRLFLGAELHDQTASDDAWRVSPMEQSLAGAGFKASFRDYYERRGYQLNAAVRFGAEHEVRGAWRDERQEALSNTSDFSVFRGDQIYRANQLAQPGRLHALVFGYTWDSRGFGEETRTARYARHQMDDLFGASEDDSPGWRVDWTSEITAPALGGDFDYRRHVLNIRRYNRLSFRHQLNLRGLVGIGEGALPPQRELAIGGIGSLPGYEFKEAAGERMLLLDVEYKFRLDRNFKPLVLYDAGRVFRPIPFSRDDWMHSLGAGVELGRDFRLEVFWPLEHGRNSAFVVRLRPTF